MICENVVEVCEADSFGSGKGLLEGTWEHANELLGPATSGEFI
jgi:hypothetical protein